MGRARRKKCWVIYGFITDLHIDAYIQIYNMRGYLHLIVWVSMILISYYLWMQFFKWIL